MMYGEICTVGNEKNWMCVRVWRASNKQQASSINNKYSDAVDVDDDDDDDGNGGDDGVDAQKHSFSHTYIGKHTNKHR